VLAPIGFDLDLTLIDSRATILDTFAALAAETGVPIDLTQVQARLGVKLEDELAHWFAPVELDRAAARYRERYVRLARTCTPVLPGARAALEAVRESGRRILIVTAKQGVSVSASLEAAHLVADEVVAHVHGPEKSEVLRRAGAAMYVGDTPADMLAACGASALAVGVTTGSFGREDLVEAAAGVVLASLELFPAWYASYQA